MSKLLLAVALLCAVAYAQAAAGTVQSNIFADNTCSKSTQNGTAIVTGTCDVAGDYSSSYYFDATNVYSVFFYGQNCSSASIASISVLPIGCAKTAFATSWATSGTSAAVPFSGTFPPSGFTVSSTYVNVSASDAKATSCSAGNGQVELQIAVNGGYCNPRVKSTFITTPSATKSFCTADGTTAGQVVFSDTSCSTSASAWETPVSTKCTITNGKAQGPSSCGSAATFPSDIPTTSFGLYSDSSCKTLIANYFIGATCFDSTTLVCGTVNTTDGYATYSRWTSLPSGAADGSCPSTPAQVIHQALGGTCVPDPSGQNYRMYSCSPSGPGASASTASVSVIATLVAAVAAVFAIRSL